MRDYELRPTGSIISFGGEDWIIKDYGESVDYYAVNSNDKTRGIYLDEWQLPNSYCPREEVEE